MSKTTLMTNESYEGESIEAKIRRITTNKEPINDGSPLIYTERKNGVEAQYNIRTDRWEIAIDAMEKVTNVHRGKRAERLKSMEKIETIEEISVAENIGTTTKE